LTAEEKLRLEDLARTWHTSPSALVQQALAQFQPTQPPRGSTDTDTSQVRLLIREVLREELPGMVREVVAAAATSTDTSADTVTDTQRPAPVADTVTDAVTDTVAEIVADTVTETPGHTPVTDAVTEMVADTVADTITDTVPETIVPQDLAAEVVAMLTGVEYAAEKYVLGKLCPRHHDYQGTGHSLRHTRNHVCLQCDREKTAERRQAKRRKP
jgi:hypothetical protein